jgi:hypothetical protein
MKWFQKPPRPAFNKDHEDVKHLIEVAFKAGGKKYYRFKEEKLISVGRYKYIYQYLKEADLRMNIETLQNYVKDFKNLLNGSGPKKIIEIGELWKLVLNLESRVSLAFEPAMVERLASVVYFDETEDLSTYDKKHGQRKIDFWNKNNVVDFFLTKPIGELFGLKDISITSLEDYITQAQQIIQDLTLDQQNQSTANSSENGSQHSSS